MDQEVGGSSPPGQVPNSSLHRCLHGLRRSCGLPSVSGATLKQTAPQAHGFGTWHSGLHLEVEAIGPWGADYRASMAGHLGPGSFGPAPGLTAQLTGSQGAHADLAGLPVKGDGRMSSDADTPSGGGVTGSSWISRIRPSEAGSASLASRAHSGHRAVERPRMCRGPQREFSTLRGVSWGSERCGAYLVRVFCSIKMSKGINSKIMNMISATLKPAAAVSILARLASASALASLIMDWTASMYSWAAS